MSNAILNHCWKLPIPQATKFVLISLADQANDASVCWPSNAHIAERTSLSDRTVQNAIKWLSRRNVVIVTPNGGPRGTNLYRITPEAFTPEPDSPPNDVHPEGDSSSPEGRSHPPPNVVRALPNEVRANPQEPTNNPKESKKQKSCRKDGSSPEILDLPDWLPPQAWIDWHEYRLKRTPKGWSDKAQELSVKTLERLHREGHDPMTVIETSIENGWSGLFPLKNNNYSRGTTDASQRQRGESLAEYCSRINRIHDEREAALGLL